MVVDVKHTFCPIKHADNQKKMASLFNMLGPKLKGRWWVRSRLRSYAVNSFSACHKRKTSFLRHDHDYWTQIQISIVLCHIQPEGGTNLDSSSTGEEENLYKGFPSISSEKLTPSKTKTAAQSGESQNH